MLEDLRGQRIVGPINSLEPIALSSFGDDALQLVGDVLLGY